MAQRKKSEVEFIQDTFCPQVAVLCSYDAEVVCRKNALTFVELVQPFCRFNGEIKISDPSNNLCTISNLRVEIKDINALPPQPPLAKKLLDESVSNSLHNSPQNFVEKQVNVNNYNFIANVNTPWFESWRECFIKVGYPDDHEFLKHFLSCIFVVSTSHLDPLDQFQKLVMEHQQAPTNPHGLPKWFFPNNQNYKYFVLLHDVQEGEISKAHQIYENLKNTYGSSNCHLLQINSKSAQQLEEEQQSGQNTVFDPWLKYCKYNDLFSNSGSSFHQKSTDDMMSIDTTQDPDMTSTDMIENPLDNRPQNAPSVEPVEQAVKPHGMCLALSDHDRIKTFISEFLQRGLVPYTERTIKMLNEQIQSKKSILKSFGLSKKFFGGSSNSIASGKTSMTASMNSGSGSLNTSMTGGTAVAGATNNYATSEELTLRRLADMAFMFRLYDLAYNSFHTCKKEFTSSINNTSGQSTEVLLNKTLYLAGALEMASLSNFMQNFQGSDPNSSVSQLNTSNIGTPKAYNLQYIDEAIQLLLKTCKNTYFATRCALLSTEALKANNLFVKAAYQFITLSSDETDMRSALFLEQAAQCYLAMSMIRKYAFFMSIAGYRFNKDGQRKHAIRVYKHALDIYENRNWHKAQDHLNFVMSRLNYNLKNLNEALSHINQITTKKKLAQKAASYNATNVMVPFTEFVHFSNETNVLKDFIVYNTTSQTLSNNSNEPNTLPLIPVPLVDCQSIKVNLLPVEGASKRQQLSSSTLVCLNDFCTDYLYDPVSSVECEIMNSLNNMAPQQASMDFKQTNEIREMWTKFEQALYTSAYRTGVPLMFKPQVTLLDSFSDNKQMAKCVLNEPIILMLELKNNLKIGMLLTDVTLLWKFKEKEASSPEVTNETSNDNTLVECSSVKKTLLAPFETYKVRFRIVPKRADGVLSIMGLKYRIGATNSQLTSSNSSISIDEMNKAANDASQSMLLGKQLFAIKGSRLNNNPQNMRSVVYDVDNRLNLKIINTTVKMQVEMDKIPSDLLCNQLEKVRVYFINPSENIPIGNIRIASNGIANSTLCFNDSKKKSVSSLVMDQLTILPNADFKFKEQASSCESGSLIGNEPLKFNFTHVRHADESFSMANASSHLATSHENVYSLDNVVIKPQEHYQIDLWIRAPDTEGKHKFYFMFFYEDARNEASPSKLNTAYANSLRYRIIRYELAVSTRQSLSIREPVSIINSQTSSNLILNFELTNHQKTTSFEMVDLVSVSNIWKTIPVEDKTKPQPLQHEHQISHSSKTAESILSIVLEGRPIQSTDKVQKKKQVYFQRTSFKRANESTVVEATTKPDQNVLFHFLKANLKKQLSNNMETSPHLTVNLIWKCLLKTDDEVVPCYGLLPVSLLSDQLMLHQQQLQQMGSVNTALTDSTASVNLTCSLRSLLSITANCKSKVSFDFTQNTLCSVLVNVDLLNLSDLHEFDLIIIAKNPRNVEREKSFLWLGCHKKYTKLKPNSSRKVQFKLGFLASGTYEIGRIASETLLKANLFEASCNVNLASASTISLDDYMNDLPADSISLGSNSLNPSSAPVNVHKQSDTAIVSVFMKNQSNGRYELFKRLNPFTVIISDRV